MVILSYFGYVGLLKGERKACFVGWPWMTMVWCGVVLIHSHFNFIGFPSHVAMTGLPIVLDAEVPASVAPVPLAIPIPRFAMENMHQMGRCTPCRFFAFMSDGCRKGKDCDWAMGGGVRGSVSRNFRIHGAYEFFEHLKPLRNDLKL